MDQTKVTTPVGEPPALIAAIPDARVGELIEEYESEAVARPLTGGIRWLIGSLAVLLSLYALYWVIRIVDPQIYRVTFLLIVLAMTFIAYPARKSQRARVTWIDWLLSALSIVALAWPVIDFLRFIQRAATPTVVDLTLGTITILLVLEATRRTVGWILPITAASFIAYAYLGPLLDLVGLELFAHRGYELGRLVGTLYMTLEGIFGVPLDVASTYIVLFTIYGAVLEYSGAGKFFL
ncbi:MAG TPA: TRAP transporter large permease subunit, partial [Chloroflexota bacterium]|nr:TRAP transporter large permease subunit [Chloroflexota bacterium]